MSLPSLRTVLTADQIQKRVRDLGRQISDDYRGNTIHVVCIIENGFMFMADLVRSLDVPVVCQFIKPFTSSKTENSVETTEIFYSPEADVEDKEVLLVEAVLHSGVTTDFVIRNMLTRGATSVKVATLLDRHSQRRVPLQPDYFGFLVDDAFLVGYGLGAPDLYRNLPFMAAYPAK